MLISFSLSFAFAQESEKTYPWQYKDYWTNYGVDKKVMTKILDKYFKHPYVATTTKPLKVSQDLAKIYRQKMRKGLPILVKQEIIDTVNVYQMNEGKQSGFKNTRNLASVLPPKKTQNKDTL